MLTTFASMPEEVERVAGFAASGARSQPQKANRATARTVVSFVAFHSPVSLPPWEWRKVKNLDEAAVE